MPSLDLPTVKALVEAAHEANMLVVAHAHRPTDALQVTAAGVDVLAHAPSEPLDEQQVEVIARSGVAVVATLSVSDGFPAPDAPMPLLTRPRLAARLGQAWTEVLHSQARRWMPPQMPSWEAARTNVAALHEAGVPILAGTDAPNPGTVHGASLHRELQHLTEAGLEPTRALHAATGAVADVFGLPDRGRVRPGARADLLLVQGRPDERITDSQEITAVWKAGREQEIDGYVGSPDETDGIEALASQTRRVVEEMSKKFPGFASPE